MSGWIKLHRRIQNNSIWNSKPFSRGQAWIDLILMANIKPAKLSIGNEIIHLDIGQFHTSEVVLSNKWGWGRKKVNLFLYLLESEKMITAVRTSKGTTITVENYTCYQYSGTGLGTGLGTSQEQRRNRTTHIVGTGLRTSKGTGEGTGLNVENYVPGEHLGTAQGTTLGTSEFSKRNSPIAQKGTLTRIEKVKEEQEVIKEKYKKEKLEDILSNYGFGQDLHEKVEHWIEYKNERKESYKSVGFNSLLKKIKSNSEIYGDQKIIDLIDECMANNWKGIIWDLITKEKKTRSNGFNIDF